MRKSLLSMALLSNACSSMSSDEQPDFSLSIPIQNLEQSACGDAVSAASPASRVDVDAVDEDSWRITAHDVPFRSSQDVCGFSVEQTETLHVLLQPCEMHPETVVRSDCLYRFEGVVDVSAALRLVLWRREDEFAGETAPQQVAEASPGWPW